MTKDHVHYKWATWGGAHCLFGLIHSVAPYGEIYLPWTVASPLPRQIALAYLLLESLLFLLNYVKNKPAVKTKHKMSNHSA
jgi:hypothetical protein